LLKWLRARDLDESAAEEMLKKAMLWRKENKVDEILTWKSPSQFQFDYAYDMEGEDDEGCPVFIIPIGRWDVRRAYATEQKHTLQKYVLQLFERALEKMRMKNLTDPGIKFVSQAVFVWDFEGSTIKQMTSIAFVDFCVNICKLVEGNYPEIVKISFSVNAPKIFPWLFNIVKPTLSTRTLEKVNIYGGNAEKWKTALLKHVHKDELPEAYGGTRKVITEFLEISSSEFEGFDETLADFEAEMYMVVGRDVDQFKL
jgi:metal transporter CNNM